MANGNTNAANIADQLNRSMPAATVTALGTTNVATLRVKPPEER